MYPDNGENYVIIVKFGVMITRNLIFFYDLGGRY